MASKTVVELLDDLDGGMADETVSFSLDGVDYEIDLSTANATALRDVFAEYVAHAHRAPARSRRTATTKAGKKGKSSASMTAEIRRLASESARKAAEAAQSRDTEPTADTFLVPTDERVEHADGEPVRTLIVPFQEAGL